MRPFRRTDRPTPPPELDAQLHQVFDDRRTPGAPETLYSYLREVSMDSSTGRDRDRLWFLGGLGRTSRAAAALTVVLIVVAGAIAVTVVIPRTIGAGAGPTAGPSLPALPSAPTGWSHYLSFGVSSGSSGAVLRDPEGLPRIAIHVVCNGPDELIVTASTDPDISDNRPLQAVRFNCDGEGRVELVATNGLFRSFLASVVRNSASIADTAYVVSIEVPDQTPTPSPSR